MAITINAMSQSELWHHCCVVMEDGDQSKKSPSSTCYDTSQPQDKWSRPSLLKREAPKHFTIKWCNKHLLCKLCEENSKKAWRRERLNHVCAFITEGVDQSQYWWSMYIYWGINWLSFGWMNKNSLLRDNWLVKK